MGPQVSKEEFEKQLRETVLALMAFYRLGADKDEDIITALEIIERQASEKQSDSGNKAVARDVRQIKQMVSSNVPYLRVLPVLLKLRSTVMSR